MKKILSAISQISIMTVTMLPILLCFGCIVNDQARFVHNVVVVGVVGFIIGIITSVFAKMD